MACNARDSGDKRSIPGLEDTLEEEMAIHSSILAKKIQWIQSVGSQNVGHSSKELYRPKCQRTKTGHMCGYRYGLISI